MDTNAQREAKLKAHNEEYHTNAKTVAAEIKEARPEEWRKLIDAHKERMALQNEFGKDPAKKAAEREKYYQYERYDDLAAEKRRVEKGNQHPPVDLLTKEERAQYTRAEENLKSATTVLEPEVKKRAIAITEKTDLSDAPQTDRSGVPLPHDNSPERKALYASSLASEAFQVLHKESRDIVAALQAPVSKTTGTSIPYLPKSKGAVIER